MPEETSRNSPVELMLIVKVEDESEPLLSLDGNYWTVKRIAELNTISEISIDFICVSYVWGLNRISNPLNVGPREISSNTLPALLAAMQGTNVTAFWIDAFCVPTVQPAKAVTLESMGLIYSLAKEVRVVLSEPSFQAVKRLSTKKILDIEAMDTLEADEWIKSVWTYQEIVNCRLLAFVCQRFPGSFVEGEDFLNYLGYSNHEYKKFHNLNSFTFRKLFPSLDAIEDVIADWMVAGAQQRSALAVMSNMDRRTWTEERNYFYSMIGTITTEPRKRSGIGQEHLAETFMKVCEDKGDFSFIYSSAPRSTDPAQKWKPRSGLLPSVLPWHCEGESQPGHFDESCSLWLDQVLVFRPANLSTNARDYLSGWLNQRDNVGADTDNIEEHAYSALVGMGFTGSQIAIPLMNGLFFTQESISATMSTIVVSATIRWIFGAPGIALWIDEDEATRIVPGVFAGIVDRASMTSIKLN